MRIHTITLERECVCMIMRAYNEFLFFFLSFSQILPKPLNSTQLTSAHTDQSPHPSNPETAETTLESLWAFHRDVPS